MRGAMYTLASLLAMLAVAGCAGSEKGTDAGWGFDTFNTQSKEDKENEKWFDSFYGNNHCHGQWAGECTPGDAGAGTGSGWILDGQSGSDSSGD